MAQASSHERPAVRCAAMAALGGLTDAAYSCLSLAEQRQIWHSIQNCGMGCASAVQAAALKAAGTLAACSSSQAYPGRNGLQKDAVCDSRKDAQNLRVTCNRAVRQESAMCCSFNSHMHI